MMGDEGGLDQYLSSLKKEYSRTYNEIAVDHMINPRNCEELTEFSGFGMDDYGLSHSVMIWLKTEDNKSLEASFSSDPCPVCTAAGSAVTELSRNKTLDELLKITAEDICKFLHGMPEEAMPCINLAVNAIHLAAEDAKRFVPLDKQ